MREWLFAEKDFPSARIAWNALQLDRSLPLDQQLEDLDEDLLLVEFPNGVMLDVGWYPGMALHGQFAVALNRNPEQWDPFLRRQCRSIAELEQIVKEFAEKAERQP